MAGLEAPLMIALTAVSAVSKATDGFAASRAQAQSDEYNAAVARNNAILAERSATQAKQQATVDAERDKRERLRIIGSQRAAAGKSGISLSGSVWDVEQDSLLNIEEDYLRSLYQGEMSAYNSMVTANSYKSQAELYEANAKNTVSSGISSMEGTLLEGAMQSAQYAYPKFSDSYGEE